MKDKAILVIDMPENCSECILCNGKMNHFRNEYRYFCSKVFDTGNGDAVQYFVDPENTKPDWCPLTSFPSRINLRQYTEASLNMESILAYQYSQGWNDCLSDIVKGRE